MCTRCGSQSWRNQDGWVISVGAMNGRFIISFRRRPMAVTWTWKERFASRYWRRKIHSRSCDRWPASVHIRTQQTRGRRDYCLVLSLQLKRWNTNANWRLLELCPETVCANCSGNYNALLHHALHSNNAKRSDRESDKERQVLTTPATASVASSNDCNAADLFIDNRRQAEVWMMFSVGAVAVNALVQGALRWFT